MLLYSTEQPICIYIVMCVNTKQKTVYWHNVFVIHWDTVPTQTLRLIETNSAMHEEEFIYFID